MNEIKLVNIDWNCYNGFTFQLMHLDLFKPINIDSSLLGVNISKRFLYIDLLWMKIKIFDLDKQ